MTVSDSQQQTAIEKGFKTLQTQNPAPKKKQRGSSQPVSAEHAKSDDSAAVDRHVEWWWSSSVGAPRRLQMDPEMTLGQPAAQQDEEEKAGHRAGDLIIAILKGRGWLTRWDGGS